MLKIFLSFSFLLFLAISSCCPETSNKVTDNGVNKHPGIQQGAVIQMNQSIVELEVEEIFSGEGEDFIVRAKVLNVEENPAYTSMAVKGNSYHLLPDFRRDENGKLKKDFEVNNKLTSLTKLRAGETFKAVITFELESGWHLVEIL